MHFIHFLFAMASPWFAQYYVNKKEYGQAVWWSLFCIVSIVLYAMGAINA
jgi:hypothetical protein